MIRSISAVAIAAALWLGPVTNAGAADDLNKQLIAKPSAALWTVYGPQTNKKVKDSKVQGGGALQVTVAKAAEQPWAVAATDAITGKISKGDQIMAVVWLKATTAAGGAASLPMRIQINAAPYTALAEKTLTVGAEWDKYEIHTVVDKDYAANSTVLQVHLGGAQQTVDLGPAIILDLGPA